MAFDAASALGDLIAAIKADRRPAKANWKGPHDLLTEADRDALVPYLDSPLCVRDIARELGWSHKRVYRTADRYGLPVRTRRVRPLRDVEAAVANMRPIEAVAWLVEAYRNLSGECPAREAHLIADYRMSPASAKLYAALEARGGQIVTHGAIDTIFEQAGYEGNDIRKRIKVEITTLRKHLVRLGWPVRIETAHRTGYRLVPTGEARP